MAKKDEFLVDYSTKVLEVNNLKKHFYAGVGKNKLVVPAVDGVTFDVYKKEVFGLVGESGCGKTTTGRTIIKLYNPTDGSTSVDGFPIAAGYHSHLDKIRQIKDERKNKIRSLNAFLKEKNILLNEYNEKKRLIELEKAQIRKKLDLKIDETKKVLSDYNEQLYTLISDVLNDIDKYKYNIANKIEDVKNRMENRSLVELRRKKLSMTNTYKRKVEGIKDSSALKKSMINERLQSLEEEYKQNLLDLEKSYEPLIEEDSKNILNKSEGKSLIKQLKREYKTEIAKMKTEVEQKKANLDKPSEKELNVKIKKLKAESKTEIAKLNEQIANLKAEYKAKISEIEKDESRITTYLNNRQEIKEILEESKEKINEQKNIISSIKAMNKSEESLAASRRMQMIFQDPISSLNPRMTVKEIVGEGIKLTKKFSDEEIEQKVAEVLELVGLAPEYATRYPHEFSGGQRQRIGVARALIMDPTVIVADEPISALDVSISAQVINLLSDLRERLGLTILFIAHDLSVVKFFCDRIAVMYYGKIVELATSEELFANPMHPYTKSLLSAIPEPDPNYEKGRKRLNYDPSMHDYRIDKPIMREIAEGHQVYANDAEFEAMKKEYNKTQVKN